MKVLIGKRDKPILKRPPNYDPNTIQGPIKSTIWTCSCGVTSGFIMQENVYTGEIWYRGPDKCSCGKPIPGPKENNMTQETIKNLFGQEYVRKIRP